MDNDNGEKLDYRKIVNVTSESPIILGRDTSRQVEIFPTIRQGYVVNPDGTQTWPKITQGYVQGARFGKMQPYMEFNKHHGNKKAPIEAIFETVEEMASVGEFYAKCVTLIEKAKPIMEVKALHDAMDKPITFDEADMMIDELLAVHKARAKAEKAKAALAPS